SDGLSALRAVEEREKPKAARHGPSNNSMQHWHTPKPIRDSAGNLRWEFRCKYCSSTRTFVRQVQGNNICFDDEPKLPPLNNLATHHSQCKGFKQQKEPQPEASAKSTNRMNLQKSAEMMASYLKDGELNPQIIATQQGFLRSVAAWILDESLPWTAGEAPTLKMLFKYLKINFQLPSDSTCDTLLIALRIIGITTDNASINNVLIATVSRCLLAKYGIPMNDTIQIRCLCHVVNLVVQDILASLGEADDPDICDYHAINKDKPVHFDPDTDEE
ncbi:hypothetical protein C8J56DRAFT_709855, partial [Mycena floridula]